MALIALVWSWIVLQITPLLIIKFALTRLIGFEWVFALQARFEVAGIEERLHLRHLPHRDEVIVDAVFVALLAGWMPGGLFLLVILVTAPCWSPSVSSSHISLTRRAEYAAIFLSVCPRKRGKDNKLRLFAVCGG